MHMRKMLLLGVGMQLSCMTLLAQDRTLTGRVTDENGQPIPSVSVQIKGTNRGTVTDANGNYTITVPSGAKALTFSSTEYQATDRNIGSGTTVNISMRNADRSMEEVVVVGYQVRRKKEEGGAVSTVSGRAIQNLPNVSVDRALQGRAAGVLVQSNNGIPGGGINVRVRGTGTFGSNAANQPLYVVDGVQMNIGGNSSFTEANALAFLNPNDIESIDVLKDAASASIYGSQAANGVVIVTTKKGRAGKTRFSLNAYTGVSERMKKLDNLSTREYIQARAEADFNRYGPQTPGYTFLDSRQWALGELSNATGLSYNTIFARGYNDKQIDSIINVLPNIDWQDETMRRGTIQNYDLSMSGGNDKTTFYLGGGYTYQSTIFNKVDFKRYTLSTNLTHKATDRLTLGLKMNLSTFEQKTPFATNGSFLGNPAFSAATIINVNRVYNEDGTYFGLLGNGQSLAGALNQNIVAVNDYNSGMQRTNQFVGSLNLDYKILSWLSYRAFVSLDYRLVQGQQYRDPRTNDGFAVKGRGTVESNWITNLLTTHTLNFDKAFGRFKTDGFVGYESRRDYSESINGENIGFPTPDFVTPASGVTPTFVGGAWSGYKRASVLGRVNLGYNQRYLLSVIARRDGSSKFGRENRFGVFPGIIGTWVIDRENFMKKADFISTLRLRASWGRTGNDLPLGNFTWRGLYGSGSQYNGNAGITYNSIEAPDVSWEINETANFGLDFGFFRNRLTGSVEYFNRKSKQALLTNPLSYLTGIGGYPSNVGEITINGTEVTLNGDLVRPRTADGLRVNLGVTFAYNFNKVSKIYGGYEVLPGDPSVRVGRSINSVFTQVYQGVNPATGRPMFLDTFGHITYAPQNRDRRYIGDQEPDYWGGVTASIGFKGFSIDALIGYEYGRLASDGQLNFMLETSSRTINGWQYSYDNRWQKPGDITSFPRIFEGGTEPGGVNSASASSRLWRKADYIRLRDLRVSYDFSSAVLRRLHLTTAKVYVQGQNLWTKSDWWGYDPEFVGTSTGIIPQTKNYNIGIQLGF
ncbi:MAG: SusC/RagA family TonB-linked outer membrane protein [Chitinophagaceae bacterium]|nr:MAG: SusC/RagA family TonB-linked outer membrane protein [Chitinophagaceae bacterium]